MNQFSKLPEFERELKKLSKKYPSLISDIEDIKQILDTYPTGIGKNFIVIKSIENVKIVKVKVQCESLRSRTIRLIYAYHDNIVTFVFIELYFKGKKENENKERIEKYLKMIE
jgi:mRNA-degrading endonuclease RelE of RelBE toxin-antitoxin system